MISIFTPTYNRAYCIHKLYESLCRQTSDNFEWIVIDDGSSDNTAELINKFIQEKKIKINFVCQPNSGKHVAINNGVKIAKGELFFIVDSDDILPENSIEIALSVYEEVRDNQGFCGICGLRGYMSGGIIGGTKNFGILDCSAIDFRHKYKMKGDMAEIVRTDILRQYPFPEYKDEKFCPEALVWFRIGLKYKFRYFSETIYLCEYLSDGLTSNIIKVRRNSPKASMLYYSEFTHLPISYVQKVKGAINYWRFASKNRIGEIDLFLLIVSYIPGIILKYIDAWKLSHK